MNLNCGRGDRSRLNTGHCSIRSIVTIELTGEFSLTAACSASNILLPREAGCMDGRALGLAVFGVELESMDDEG